MSRIAVEISCTADDKKELERLSKSRTDESRMVERAKIILGCLAGRRNDEIASELGIQAATAGVWRKRFAAEGLAGLRDRARPVSRLFILCRNCDSESSSNSKRHPRLDWRVGMAAR